MADLPYTVCSRVGPDLHDWLQELAKENNRKLSDVIRILLEKVMAYEKRREKK